jgi:hypothetical protein
MTQSEEPWDTRTLTRRATWAGAACFLVLAVAVGYLAVDVRAREVRFRDHGGVVTAKVVEIRPQPKAGDQVFVLPQDTRQNYSTWSVTILLGLLALLFVGLAAGLFRRTRTLLQQAILIRPPECPSRPAFKSMSSRDLLCGLP